MRRACAGIALAFAALAAAPVAAQEQRVQAVGVAPVVGDLAHEDLRRIAALERSRDEHGRRAISAVGLVRLLEQAPVLRVRLGEHDQVEAAVEVGRASCRERV